MIQNKKLAHIKNITYNSIIRKGTHLVINANNK